MHYFRKQPPLFEDGLIFLPGYYFIYKFLLFAGSTAKVNACCFNAILAKQLNISPQQMKYVTHTEAGEGLIFYGNVVLPFVDHFPKDTELYSIMTTKPEEVSSL